MVAAYCNEVASHNYICLQITPQALEELPPHPIIVAYGALIYASRKFEIFIEKNKATQYSTFLEALAYQFVSFYVYNIHYPESCAATYEFIQRHFAGVNLTGIRSKKRRRQVFTRKSSVLQS